MDIDAIPEQAPSHYKNHQSTIVPSEPVRLSQTIQILDSSGRLLGPDEQIKHRDDETRALNRPLVTRDNPNDPCGGYSASL